MNRPRIVILGYYGFGNGGDELILHALIQNFRREDPQAMITVLSSQPAMTARIFGVQAVDRWKVFSWVRPLIEADRFILGGGGLLQETTGPWNYFYYLSLLVLAKCFGCKTEVHAIGVDWIRHRSNRFWARFVLNHWVDRLSVRDESSRTALSEAGVLPPISIVPDPVFMLRSPRLDARRRGIALALSPIDGRPQWGHEVAELCDRLAENGCTPIDLLVFFPQQDGEFSRRVAQLSYGVRLVREWSSIEDLISWIPEYQIVLGMRYHALVLAHACGTPFVGWGAQEKLQALCRRTGSASWSPAKEDWVGGLQTKQILALYQSADKSVILTRTD